MAENKIKRLQTAANIAVSRRNYRRCRDRALTKLSQAHKEEYLEYLKEEQQRDNQEGRRWLDLDGNTGSRNNSRSPQRATKRKLSRRRGGRK